MSAARVAVIRFPGVNCEAESARALARVGLEPEVFMWTRPASELRDFQAYLLPGGFSYQDRVRAGALAAKDPLVEVLAEEAGRGKPVLGICNGAQVLVEAGLVPGGSGVELALARNRMPDRSGYYARWITTRVEPSRCVFTRSLEPGTLLPLPVAHGEGRFTAREAGRMDALNRAGQVPLRYASSDGATADSFPVNPNGAEAAAAAVCNGQGNVLALMPHPERAQDAGALPPTVAGRWAGVRDAARMRGDRDAAGPGLLLFEGLRRHLMEA
jgi:phosphoribosylformylglycinamidine synthase subunit PurQ / glutaminase